MSTSIALEVRDDLADVEHTISQIRLKLLNHERHSSQEKERSDFALHFVETIKANVDNDKLSDAEFRAFIRNSIK